MPKAYQTKATLLAGTNYTEVCRKARAIYKQISSRTKRKPYIRSAFFNKEKVFLDYFWQHIFEKRRGDRQRRLAYYECALELLQKSKIAPISLVNVDNKSEILHRFAGITKSGKKFFVQVKEDIKSRQKHFISLFPHP